jgi:hypothetical protein
MGALAPTIHHLGMFPMAVKRRLAALPEINSQPPIGSPDHFAGSGWSAWHVK